MDGITTRRGTPKRVCLSVVAVLALLAAACSSGGTSGSGSTAAGGTANLVMWMGFTPPPPVSQSYEYLTLKALVAQFTKLHPKIHIQMQYGNSDFPLQHATAAS